MITQFAQLFETHTPSLVWALPVGIPILFFLYAPFILFLVGLIQFVVTRLSKKHTAQAKTFLGIGAYYLVWYLLELFVLHFTDHFNDQLVYVSHVIFTFALIVVTIFLTLNKKFAHKYAGSLKAAQIVSIATVVLYVIEIIGLIGHANSL